PAAERLGPVPHPSGADAADRLAGVVVESVSRLGSDPHRADIPVRSVRPATGDTGVVRAAAARLE
ncbi:MAG: hypothetical protein WB592_07135, partial [Acidimicrobiales bacterium]